MAQFRKKPVVIDAFQWIGKPPFPPAFSNLHKLALINDREQLIIRTLEGEMAANDGDWIIKGVKGEFYPCKPDIFAATYEEVPF